LNDERRSIAFSVFKWALSVEATMPTPFFSVAPQVDDTDFSTRFDFFLLAEFSHEPWQRTG